MLAVIYYNFNLNIVLKQENDDIVNEVKEIISEGKAKVSSLY